MPPDLVSVGTETASANSSKCSQCRDKPARYRCPGCTAHTCGLECVKSHKAESGCSGKRDRTAFVALKEFDDKNLVSDYNFLEEVSQESETAKRVRMEIGVQGPPGRNEGLPPGLRVLQLEALNRGVTLRFLARGMTRRTQNSSFFDKKRKCLFWRVEWRFGEADVTLIDGKCDENTILREAVDRHLSGVKVPGGNQQSSREKLGAYVKAGVDQLRFFIRHPSRVRGREGHIKSALGGRCHLALCSLQPGIHSSRVYSWQTWGAAGICWGSLCVSANICPCSTWQANEEKFVEIDGRGPLRSELDALTIIEFPRIHVALPSEVRLYPTVEIERRRKRQERGEGIAGVEVLAKDGREQIGKVYREEDVGGGTT